MNCTFFKQLFSQVTRMADSSALSSTRELLGRAIQTGGGTTGHSSVEDSIATLDLVRWFILNNNQGPKKAATQTSSVGSSVQKSTTR